MGEGKRESLKGLVLIILMVLLCGLIVGLGIGLVDDDDNEKYVGGSHNGDSGSTDENGSSGTEGNGSPDLVTETRGEYRFAAVSSSSPLCSTVGINILGRGGSVVDAAISTELCVGVVKGYFVGIGGGYFMTVLDRMNNETDQPPKAKAIMGRELAPGVFHEDYYVDDPDNTRSYIGGTSVGIPSVIGSHYEAWKLYGKLPWKDLLEPAYTIAENGFEADNFMEIAIDDTDAKYFSDSEMMEKHPWLSNLENLLTNPETNALYRKGEIIKRPMYATTLRTLSDDPLAFYQPGSLRDAILRELNDAGSEITAADLENYEPKIYDAISNTLSNGDIMYSVPPPSSGIIVQLILLLVDRMNMTAESVSTVDKMIDTYYEIVELLKFSFASRTGLGDISFNPHMDEYMENITSPEALQDILDSIPDMTQNLTYYKPDYITESDGGTAHISVLTDKAAVGLTSSLNLFFGSKVAGAETGIIYNDQMDDFSTPVVRNHWGFLPSPANFIEAGKSPQSSMSPLIIVTPNGQVKYVTGAAGGSRIISSIAWVAIHTLWFGYDLDEATQMWRLHHQLSPNQLNYEEESSYWDHETQEILDAMERKGHTLVELGRLASIVHSVYNKCADQCPESDEDACLLEKVMCVVASSDSRDEGGPDGY